LGGREVFKDWETGRIGRLLTPLENVFLQLDVQYVSYNSGDYRKESLVHNINVVLHVVEIHTNICIYYSVVHPVRILDK
jgi:predicted P-loop ATPase/GTPase